jgi:hypothetical protein
MPGASSSWTPGQSGNGKGWSKVVAGVGLGVAGMGADYLTDKYTEEGSNANIGGKAPSGALSGAAMGAMLGPVRWCINWWIIWWYNSSNERTKINGVKTQQ